MGKTNDEISRTVHRARDTVKHQVSGILSKLNVSTRQEAVVLAIRLGMLADRRRQSGEKLPT
jgi:DNA-binding NarL/FixJ family response regulator